jgi:predicted nucleic acid-binding protein
VLAVDSSYFIALADSNDKWHNDALRLSSKIPRGFIISDLVVAESITIIGERGGGKAAQTLYEYFVDECEIEFVDEDLLGEAMALHLQFDGTLSVADCVSVALMSQRRIGKLVSFDSDFDKVRGIERIH